MSARTPFMPVSRPPSRVPSQQDSAKSANPQFSIDPSNPLNASAATASKTSIHIDLTSQTDNVISTASSNGAENRPLNTSSLVKRKNQVQPTSVRRPFLQANDKALARPDTADPRPTTQQEPVRSSSFNIIAPVPRQAPRPSSPSLSTSLASGVFSINSNQSTMPFRVSDMPPVALDNNQLKNDTHTLGNLAGFSFSNPHAVVVQDTQTTQQLPSPPDSLRARDGARNFVNANTDTPPRPFSLNISGANQTGPQRVLLNPDGTRGPLIDQDDTRLTLNRADSSLLKRAHPDIDAEHQDDVHEYKRYRSQEDGLVQGIRPQLSSPEDASASGRSRNLSRTPDHDSHYAHYNPPPSPSDSNYRAQGFYPRRSGAGDGHMTIDTTGALDKILGSGVNAYAEEHVEQYERAVQRWKECTMEEWIAGANEQTARYNKILDFVKDHMTSKMKLFASFDAKVDGHNAVLSEREKALEAVKERLVQESSHVLGQSR